ncbi:ribosomal RNA processing protein 41B [Trypanosoma equiperdum]|uniref:Ribosomal RNA processing protein 41B n=1 Tax=Trypanosoma equiperdum TaxID=5694 RepID=A0A1G4I8X6_TRYEQ|nr:ribosomal RNA processing protein 41B [Trypanosoma equiperdum]
MATISRRDGRTAREMRGKELRTSDLSQFDGSAWYSQGLTAVTVAINGPTAARQENYRRCTTCIHVNRAARIPQEGGTGRLIMMERRERERCEDGELKQFLTSLVEAIVCLDRFPRCVLEAHVTVLMDDGALFAVASNAIMCALLDAGVPCRSTIAAVSLIMCNPEASGNEGEPEIFLDPTAVEESTDEVRSYASATFVLTNTGGEAVLASRVQARPRSSAYSRSITPKDLSRMFALAAKAAETLFVFFRNCSMALE